MSDLKLRPENAEDAEGLNPASLKHKFCGADGRMELLTTPSATNRFDLGDILIAAGELQDLAAARGGIGYRQVFDHPEKGQLWFIQDEPLGPVTALLPADY